MLVCTENITNKKKIIIVIQNTNCEFVRSLFNPYPANIFCPENIVCFLHLLHILKFTSD